MAQKQVYIFLVILVLAACGKTARDWKTDFEGVWKAPAGKAWFCETWIKKQNKLYGTGFLINEEGDTTFGEKLELFERGESLIYVAFPGDNRRVEFSGKRNEGGRYSFYNSVNEFPSRIDYTFEDGKMNVTLSGSEKGKRIKEKLKMTREK
jgi:hypothetical protein